MAKKSKKTGSQHPIPDPILSSEELSVESASRSQCTVQRPKTSPYTSSPVTLRIGPENREYYVPQDLLQNPGWIASSHSWRQPIYLPDVDNSTSHVLVHYLYTGAYQTLDDMETSLVKELHIEFKRAVLAYITAKKYDLDGLQHLAKHKIEYLGAEMNVFEIIEAIKEDFSKLPSDATWFHDYVSRKVEAAFEEDHTVFIHNDLFGCIDNVTLIRVLAKRVVEIYNNRVSHMLSIEKEPVSEIPEEHFNNAEKSFAIGETPVEDCPAEECPAKEYPVEYHPVEDCAIEETCIQESSTEEPVLPAEELPVDPFAGLSKSQKKKLERKMEKNNIEKQRMEMEERERMEIERMEIERMEIERMEMERMEIERMEIERMEMERIEMERMEMEIERQEREKEERVTVEQPSLPHPDAEPEQPTKVEGGVCPLRAKHLLEGDQWKTCRQCGALLYRVTIELARTSQADEVGYEMVDRVFMN